MAENALTYQLYIPNDSLEPGSIVGTGREFTRASIPLSLLYPGKIIFDLDSENPFWEVDETLAIVQRKIDDDANELWTYSITPSGDGLILIMSDVIANIINITVNHMVYYGTRTEGVTLDFTYLYSDGNTVIIFDSANSGLSTLKSKAVNVLYNKIT